MKNTYEELSDFVAAEGCKNSNIITEAYENVKQIEIY